VGRASVVEIGRTIQTTLSKAPRVAFHSCVLTPQNYRSHVPRACVNRLVLCVHLLCCTCARSPLARLTFRRAHRHHSPCDQGMSGDAELVPLVKQLESENAHVLEELQRISPGTVWQIGP
jgi:hypothetical protein